MSQASRGGASDFAVGQLLSDRYRIEAVIGRGGVATVYRAFDTLLGRPVALKRLPGASHNPVELQRQLDEVQLIAQFSHPGLVTLHDLIPDTGNGTSTLVMQLIDGDDLGQRITNGPLDAAETARIGADVAAALAYVHERGVIHRDVKPGNILLPTGSGASTGQSAVLADFGIARLIDAARLTSTGTIIGTASYLSPEQAAGVELGPATDVYSLGLVLLEARTGARAFGGSVAEAMAARLSADPSIPADLGAEWGELLAAMTDRDPGVRPNALEVGKHLMTLPTAPNATPSPADTTSGDATTKVLVAAVPPDQDSAATELLHREAGQTATTVAMSVPPRSVRSSRPRPSRRTVATALAIVIGVLALAVVLYLIAASLTATTSPGTNSNSSTASSPLLSTDAPPPPVTYPTVPGRLGDKLNELEASVADLDSDQGDTLRDEVLAVAQAASTEEYETALASLDQFDTEVEGSQLTAGERDSITRASEAVRSELDKLVPGKPGKPGKGH